MNDYEWDKKDLQFLRDWIEAVKPKLKASYSGFIFCDARMQYKFETIIKDYFEIKNRLVWIRKNMANGRVIKNRFISSYEVVFYFGNKDLNLPASWGEERFDSFEYATPQSNFNEGKFHPTQKPLELFKRLVKVGSKEHDLVLDPFAGSGTTGLACLELKRDCILIEKEDEYITTIKGRLNGMG
jgi:site-specific DNA-methyltransferase (adenine-specific)